MKSTYKNLFRIAIIAITAVLFCAASCEKSEKVTNNKAKDTNPYSETRNENLSLLGFYWNGITFTQHTRIHLFTAYTYVKWNTVRIEEEDYLIVNSTMLPTNGGDPSKIWLIMPFQDIELNKPYSSKIYTSLANLYSYKPPFIVEGESRKWLCAPLTVTVRYTKNDNQIQGNFTAEGESLESVEGKSLSIYLYNGVFNLNITYGDNLDRNYTYEKWLEETERVIEGYSDEEVWKRILN